MRIILLCIQKRIHVKACFPQMYDITVFSVTY